MSALLSIPFMPVAHESRRDLFEDFQTLIRDARTVGRLRVLKQELEYTNFTVDERGWLEMMAENKAAAINEEGRMKSEELENPAPNRVVIFHRRLSPDGL